MRTLRCAAGGGRVFSGLSAGKRIAVCQKVAGKPEPHHPESLYKAVRHGRGASGLLPVQQHRSAGENADSRAAVGCLQPCTGGGAGGAGRDCLCSQGAGAYCTAASCFAGRFARTGAAGTGWQRELSAVPGTGNAGRCLATARHRAAQLRQLPRTGRQLVPHCRAHRA